jgi:spore maturation protein CgeB
MSKVDTTLFTKKIGKDLFMYVDDIIFGSTNQDFCEEFGKMMANEFEMSMIGELSYFLGLQIKQMKNDTFVSQGKYIKDMIKKFVCKMQKLLVHLWGQMETWIMMLVAIWWIKSCNDL